MIASDETVRELRRTIDEHMSGGGDALAMQALEGLSAIRDDRSLLHIHSVSMRARGKLKKRALQILGDVCRQRGLSHDELEDRIVPELGLDEHGTMVLDYGARRFTVGFDELLRPFVRDAAGNRLAGLPHASKADDEEKATHAADAWKILKDEVKSIGTEQAHRLERAMCDEREWSSESFGKHLVVHRLLGHLARRLVYRVVGGAVFRVAEDGSYAGIDDVALAIAPTARVAIVHPARLLETARAQWQRILHDYEVMQPFPQLDRETVTLDAEEMKTTVTRRFEGKLVHGGHFFGLHQRGWENEWNGLRKRLAPNLQAVLQITPGIESFARKPEDQTLGTLTMQGLTFSAMPPVARFEVLRDIELVATG